MGILIPQAMTPFFKKNRVFINNILHTFKLYEYKSREKQLANINNLIVEIRTAKRIESKIALTNSMKTIAFTKKCYIINNIIPYRR